MREFNELRVEKAQRRRIMRREILREKAAAWAAAAVSYLSASLLAVMAHTKLCEAKCKR